jgi:hypothetical protein
MTNTPQLLQITSIVPHFCLTELSSPSQPPYHVYCLQTCNGKFQVYIPPSPDGVWVIHTGKHTLYFICHTEPVRLAEHLRGTRKSGPKDKTVLFTVSFRLHVWGDWGTCPTAISAFSDRCAAGSPCCLYTCACSLPPPVFVLHAHSIVLSPPPFFCQPTQSLCLTHTGTPTGVAVSHRITWFQTQPILSLRVRTATAVICGIIVPYDEEGTPARLGPDKKKMCCRPPCWRGRAPPAAQPLDAGHF